MNLICKIKVCALWIAACSLSLTSCFKDEPLNTECDITQVTLHVNEPAQFFFQLTDSVKNVLYTDSTIVISVRSHADVSHLAPQFVITEGATITPAAGEPQDFTHGPVTYTVTSQDGQWHRTYRMSVVPTTITVNDTLKIDFEHFDLEPSYNSYYVWFQQLADGSLSADWWTSGNAGFKFSMGSAKPDEYPTCVLANGYDGYGLQLITRDTGPFGRMASKNPSVSPAIINISPAARSLTKKDKFKRVWWIKAQSMLCFIATMMRQGMPLCFMATMCSPAKISWLSHRFRK